MQFLNNPWFIGIGGGVLSGTIVTLLTRYFFSKKDNKEFFQRIVTANHEVLFAIRPGISEGEIPDQRILSSIISATSKKYNLEQSDLLSSEEIADELIKEIMDSSFISTPSKKEFCSKLLELKAPQKKGVELGTHAFFEASASYLQATRSRNEYRQRMLTTMSGTLGAMAGLTTILIVLMDKDKFIGTEPVTGIFPIAISISTALIATVIAAIFLKLSRKTSKVIYEFKDMKSNKAVERNS